MVVKCFCLTASVACNLLENQQSKLTFCLPPFNCVQNLLTAFCEVMQLNSFMMPESLGWPPKKKKKDSLGFSSETADLQLLLGLTFSEANKDVLS